MRLSLIVLSILVQAGVALGSCDGIFRFISDARWDGEAIKRAEACFKSGTCTVLIDKPRQKSSLRRERLDAILGHFGRIIEGSNPAVNCHSYACMASGVPLPYNSWLDPDRSYITLLREFFTSTGLTYGPSNFDNFGYDPRIRDGDLILMKNERGALHHSGIIRKLNGYNWVDSKLDEDMVVRTPLDTLLSPYLVNEVNVYRRK
jgi:hypothetical protein